MQNKKNAESGAVEVARRIITIRPDKELKVIAVFSNYTLAKSVAYDRFHLVPRANEPGCDCRVVSHAELCSTEEGQVAWNKFIMGVE